MESQSIFTFVEIEKTDSKIHRDVQRLDTCTPMFMAAVFIIARTWKQPRCPSADEWIRKLWYIYTMEYYSAIKKRQGGLPSMAQGCIPKRLLGRPDEALGGGNQDPSAPGWGRQHHSQRDTSWGKGGRE